MGRPKLLLPWQGRPIISHLLAAWQASGVTQTVVVLHHDDQELIALCRQAEVEVVLPATPPEEMKVSIRHALERIAARWQPEAGKDVWLLAPADMPELSPAVIDRLLAEHRPDKAEILVPVCDGERGHPVLFPWETAADISQLAPHEGVNALVARRGWRAVPLADRGLLRDLDTPDDYRRLLDQ